MMFSSRRLVTIASLAMAFPASAQTSQTFTYDVHGRLASARTGTASSAQTSEYEYDGANNRTVRRTTSSEPVARRARIVVLPLNGFTIIPIRREETPGGPITPSAPPPL